MSEGGRLNMKMRYKDELEEDETYMGVHSRVDVAHCCVRLKFSLGIHRWSNEETAKIWS